jgi:hypothetical protein
VLAEPECRAQERLSLAQSKGRAAIETRIVRADRRHDPRPLRIGLRVPATASVSAVLKQGLRNVHSGMTVACESKPEVPVLVIVPVGARCWDAVSSNLEENVPLRERARVYVVCAQ